MLRLCKFGVFFSFFFLCHVLQILSILVLQRESKKKKDKKSKLKPSSALSFNLDEEEGDDDSEPGYIFWLFGKAVDFIFVYG